MNNLQCIPNSELDWFEEYHLNYAIYCAARGPYRLETHF